MSYSDSTKVCVKVLERLAQYDPNMQLSTALALLYVAQNEDVEGGVTTRDLSDWLGFTPAAASRNSYYWADGTSDMPNSGYGLIRVDIDPMDRRKRLLSLTPRGKHFISKLEEIIDGTS